MCDFVSFNFTEFIDQFQQCFGVVFRIFSIYTYIQNIHIYAHIYVHRDPHTYKTYAYIYVHKTYTYINLYIYTPTYVYIYVRIYGYIYKIKLSTNRDNFTIWMSPFFLPD